jgi:hypothetical protein
MESSYRQKKRKPRSWYPKEYTSARMISGDVRIAVKFTGKVAIGEMSKR